MANVNADELENAMILMDDPGSGEAWVCRTTGKVHMRSDMLDLPEAVPDDVEDEDKYVPVPGLKQLDLGQALVSDFVTEHMPDAEDEVRGFFRRSGAYRRFSHLVDDRGLTDRWHAFRDERTRAAMREWCADNGLTLAS